MASIRGRGIAYFVGFRHASALFVKLVYSRLVFNIDMVDLEDTKQDSTSR